jgi:hypothetical protein
MMPCDSPKQRGNRAESESGRHQQRRIHRFAIGRGKELGDWANAHDLRGDLDQQKEETSEGIETKDPALMK